ncbi:MAG: hypothetical protein JWO32_1068 [Bacteroidetes bacterium]|nr:hypothetical protein [Bacteroidota bacterium]
MRLNFLIISSVLMLQLTLAQNNSSTVTTGNGTLTTMGTSPSTGTVSLSDQSSVPSTVALTDGTIMDYKSVYESATLEEEVKMATERFSLTKAQQDVWLTEAADRRVAEKRAHEQLESKDANINKDNVYKGLRGSQNTFYQKITGYLSPSQKQAMETDRAILEEKRKRVAKLPPPVPTVTVIPVDSVAIKAAEKEKTQGKKSKKKKKPVGA